MSEEQQIIAGDLVYGDRVGGDKVGGDKITLGDLSGSYNAIGAGAQVIVTQIQQALSAVDEMEKGIQAAERRLAAAITQKIGRYAHLIAPAEADARENPYKALLDYKLEDAPFFYGRSQAVKVMWQKMGNGRLTILHSESGSGKTSLLQAGLASRLLANGRFPLYLRPYRQSPDQFIKKEFLPDYAAQPELRRFRDDQMSLKGFLERTAYYLGGRQIYIFLDQFEEFFTEQSPEMQRAFAGQLQECVESDLPVRWVLSLRKEYFSDLRLFGRLRPFDNEYFLPTFRLEEAQEVVTEPAALKGVQYEAGLVDHILADLRQEDRGIPPAQVQLVCYTLFDELPTAEQANVISHALYARPRGRGAGEPGAKGILTSHLTRVLDRELKGAERRIANRVLEELVTSDRRRAVRSRAQLASELETADSATLEHVLATLHENRLIRLDLDDNDQPRYELTHDYLLSEIELNPETQARKAAQELLAQELAAYRQFGTLLSKDRFDIIHSQVAFLKIDETAQTLLQESEAVLEAERLHELEQERALAEAQRQRAEEAEQAAAKQSRLTRIAFAVGGIAVVLFIVAVMAGVSAVKNAETARMRERAELERERAIENADEANAASTRAAETAENLVTAEQERERADKEAETAIAQARIAQSQGLASASLAVMEEDSMRGLLLAIAAGETSETPLAYDAMREAVDRNGRLLHGFTHEGSVNGASWNGTESEILTWSDDGTARLWDATSGAERLRFTHEEPVNGASWNGTESEILTWSSPPGGGDGAVRLWDAASGEERLRFTHEGWVLGASWNGAESEILTWSSPPGGGDGAVRLWDTASGEERLRFTHEGWVLGASWNGAESEILTWSDDGTVRLRDAASGEELLRFIHEYPVDGAIWNGAESEILTWSSPPEGGDGAARLWDAATGAELLRFTHEATVRGASWNAAGSEILTWSGDGTARLWDAVSGAERLRFIHEAEVLGASWNGAESEILTWSQDGTARLWDAASGDELLRFTHVSWVEGASWNYAGTEILTWSEDGTARLRDATSGASPFTLTGDGSPVVTAQWSQDERRILYVTAGGFADIFYTQMADLLAEACQRTTRNFTWQEWQLYFPGQPYRVMCEQHPVHPTVPEQFRPES